jgi:hypothetical protein
VWGFRAMGRTRTVDSHASRVRRKLAAATDTPYVLNEWGVNRGVVGRVARWCRVASLSRSSPLCPMARRAALAAYGH